uniref:DHA2 family efflux MFS transporter permease subunit n=1 Tax=Burkholderia anthina TaxID=179879 RepID=UPI00158AFD1F|nr:DHA2 family efflux MFS transporter permease subunit [Burkholderia anthina]
MADAGIAAARPLEGVSKHVATGSIMLATILTGLDSTIANVALPQIQRSLGVSQDAVVMVLTSYVVATAIATPLVGWLAARLGRKTLYLLSIAGFTLASIGCGAATTLTLLVWARIAQGVFGAALIPLSQALILDINPQENHARALSHWGAGVMLGPILGPVVGGLVGQWQGWRWVFYVNVPVGLLAFTGVALWIGRTSLARARPFDVVGFVTLSAAVGFLQTVLDTGQQAGWFRAPRIVAATAIAVVAFALFVRHVMRTPAGGFFERRLLADRNYATGLCFTAIVGVVLFATRALLPQLLVHVEQYSIVATGLLMAPTGVGTLAAMLAAGAVIKRIDPRRLMASGFLVASLALLELCLLGRPVSPVSIIVSGTMLGVGLGLIFAPLNAATFATLDAGLRADGAAIFALARNVGSSAGVALMQSLLTRFTEANLATHAWADAAFAAYLTDFRLLLTINLVAIPWVWVMKYRRA